MPACGFRASPLNTLRVPKRLLALCGTGTLNGVVQRRCGVTVASSACVKRVSSSMRAISAAGGFTKSGFTFSVRVGKVRGVTVKALSAVAPVLVVTVIRYSPAA